MTRNTFRIHPYIIHYNISYILGTIHKKLTPHVSYSRMEGASTLHILYNRFTFTRQGVWVHFTRKCTLNVSLFYIMANVHIQRCRTVMKYAQGQAEMISHIYSEGD